MPVPTIHLLRKTFVPSLWLGVIGAPVIWGLHLQALYALVGVAKATGHYRSLYLTTAACAALCLVCCALSWHDWRATRASRDGLESSSPAGRTRFLSLIGVVGSAFFALTILATGLTVCFLQADWD